MTFAFIFLSTSITWLFWDHTKATP